MNFADDDFKAENFIDIAQQSNGKKNNRMKIEASNRDKNSNRMYNLYQNIKHDWESNDEH